jgi:glycosyltransferase involved in cell wall biosynthesis
MLARGDEVDLVTMAYQDLPRLERRGRLTIHRIPCGRRAITICHPHEMLLYILRALPIVLRLAHERRPDINHTHFIFPDGVLAMVLARTRGLKYIVTAHGSDVPGYNPDRFKLLHRLLKPLWHAVVRNTETVLCPSEYLKRLLLDSAPEARCEVIPNGVDVLQYSTDRLRRKRILVISRMVERKGVQFLLQALAGLEHEHEVCIVGDGPYLPDLRLLAAALDVKVTFTGFIDNETRQFRELLETSSIFVFTSSRENFPMVLLEAMSAGLCVVTSDDTGCQEVVGDAAIKVPSEDAGAIRAALIELMQDPARCEALGLAARSRAENFFTDDRIADQYRRTYQLHAAHDVS